MAQTPVGWASVSVSGLSTTTGGAGGREVTATSASQLSTHCGSTETLIIRVSGIITGTGSIAIQSNKTIVGEGNNTQLQGVGLSMNGVSNIIIRNLKISGSVDGIAARNTHHLWVDHCELWDCSDGLLDITVESSYATVSWCKFYYVNQMDHRFSALIGSGGGTQPNDWGKLKVTYHHNWFGARADQRMPRLMYGQGHAFNNYYSSTGNSYCIGVGSYGSMLIENNYFKNVKDPHTFMYDVYCWIVARGNTYDGTTGSTDIGKGGTRHEAGQESYDVQPYTPPYSYTLDPVADVPALVMNGAGPEGVAVYNLSVSSSSVNVAVAASSTGIVNINSNVNWTASSNQTWLSVSPASGSNNGTVTVTAAQNTATSTRSATVTVAATGVASQTVTVTQAAASVPVPVTEPAPAQGGGGGGALNAWTAAVLVLLLGCRIARFR